MNRELFVEILCEELPAEMIQPALDGLRDGIVGLLAGVSHGAVQTWTTPRRLAVAVADVAPAREKVQVEVTGPPADRAFKDGQPTPAGLGFARGRGVDPAALRIVDGPKGQVVAVTIEEGGEQVIDLIAQNLDRVIREIPFARSMEWGEGGIRFGRPIHRVNALYDGAVVAGEAVGVTLGAATRGHRLVDDPELTFTDSTSWLVGLRDRYVEPDPTVRRARILAILDEVSAELGADTIRDESLLDEVVHLVEWPVKVIGTFEESLLELPPRLLITSMRVHQRYFPVHREGALTNRFVVISNNPYGDPERIATGNARVIRARFADARFFYGEDRSVPLEEHGQRLERMRWIRGLGTMADRQARLALLGTRLAATCDCDADVVTRAGALCKADLTTQMVGEFPELQGHMGRLYAAAQGEATDVALAIEEHYHPRFAGDTLPTRPAGVALALADRLDTLVGCFGIGLVPKGGGDPQGLRRAALGVVVILLARGIRAPLEGLLATAIDGFHRTARTAADFDAWTKARGVDPTPRDRDALGAALLDFVLARYRADRVGDGCPPDLVDAVLDAPRKQTDLVDMDARVAALRELSTTDDFPVILQTFKRVLNITRGADVPRPRYEDLTHPAEHELLSAIEAVEADAVAAVEALDHSAAARSMVTLQGPVAAFFDAVLVDAPEPEVRAARLGLLRRVGDLFLLLADFSRISTR